MADNLPASLQQKFNVQGFTHSIGKTTLRSNVEVGPAKVRRRFTKSVDPYKGSIVMSYDEYDTLYNFYQTTLDGGTKKFNFEDPFSQLPAEFRFINEPNMTPIGTAGIEYRVTFDLEKLP